MRGRAGEALSAAETDALAQQRIDRLYLRFFDIDLGAHGTPAPIAEVSLAAGAQLPATLEVLPVVFIRNRALDGMDRGAGRALAKKIRSQIDLRAAALGVLPKEIQLD